MATIKLQGKEKQSLHQRNLKQIKQSIVIQFTCVDSAVKKFSMIR